MKGNNFLNLSPEGLAKFLREMGIQFSEANNNALQLINDLEKSNSELSQTQESLIKAAKLTTIGTMAAGVVHDIKSPLSVILFWAENLSEKSELSDEVKNRLKSIKNAANQILEIIIQLQNIANQNSGQIKKNLKPVNLADLLEGVFSSLKFKLEGEKISWRISKLITTPLIEADIKMITRIIQNLVANSIDAFSTLEKRGAFQKQIDVCIYKEDKFIKIKFQDNAGGMPAHILKKVFDPFFTTKKPGKGEGLGLYNCDSIMKLHNGTIEAQSQEGQGSVFILTFPAQEKSEPAPN